MRVRSYSEDDVEFRGQFTADVVKRTLACRRATIKRRKSWSVSSAAMMMMMINDCGRVNCRMVKMWQALRRTPDAHTSTQSPRSSEAVVAYLRVSLARIMAYMGCSFN